MKKLIRKSLLACFVAASVSSCGDSNQEQNSQLAQEQLTQTKESIEAVADSVAESNLAVSAQETIENTTEQWTESEELTEIAEQLDTEKTQSLSTASGDIPYPLYPNGSKYRIGGENGLRIVLFQTEDSFQEVDSYFQAQVEMSRLDAMQDYVRYSASADDVDPWATSKPGIVIHEFNNESEKSAVGADDTARTNIIMSY